MKKIYHFGTHANKNAGDAALLAETQQICNHFIPNILWQNESLWEPMTDGLLKEINAHGRAVMVGGGGLFLKDQAGAPVGASGWQWNCPLSALKKLEVPLIVFAVGYNRFRGQEDFGANFAPHVQELVRRASFIGIRNGGSIRALRNYLVAPSAQAKLTFQPCPTTLLSILHPELTNKPQKKWLAVNVAYDRLSMRLADAEASCDALASALGVLQHEDGWDLTLVHHKQMDMEFSRKLNERSIAHRYYNASNAIPSDLYRVYSRFELVLAMRGHGQMIPFGLGIPVLSLITHDKLQWFLEDAELESWGIEMNAEKKTLTEEIVMRTRALERRSNQVRKQVKNVQKEFWGITEKNMRAIARAIA